MYLGCINHSHFSGSVPITYILNYIESKTLDNVRLSRKGKYLYLEYGKKGNMTNCDEVMDFVEKCWKTKDSNAIGALLFGLIKHKDFYTQYMELLYDLLEDENVDHIDLRLKLGSLHPVKGNVIKEELILLNKILGVWQSDGKSFSIIVQASKHHKVAKIEKYFMSVLNVMKTTRLDPYLISGFDITGSEEEGNLLSEYEEMVKRLQERSSLPWYFHAGETGIVDNLDFANYYGEVRVGHAISGDTHLVRELCPYTYKYLHDMSDDDIKEIVDKGNFTISPDDTNKFNDMTMGDNVDYLVSLGCDVKEAIRNSILVTRVAKHRKMEMLRKLV